MISKPIIRRTTAAQRWSIILLLPCVFLATPAVFSQSKYVKKYAPIADSLGKEYGIPSSIILAVAILESGSGTSRNAKLLNNHFGIVGKNDLLPSKGIKSVYKQYPSVRASYIDFCRVLRKKKYYKTLRGNSNYVLWVDAISKAGYSEIPEIWKKRVLEIIRKNRLAS